MKDTLVVFDIDGTIVDSGNIIFEALSRTLTAFNIAVPERQRALHVVGLSLVEAFADLTGDGDHCIAMAEHYKNLFGGLRASGEFPEPLYPDAEAVIRKFQQSSSAALGIATGKSLRGVDHLLDRLSWTGWFSTIQTADSAPSKPHPGMLLQAVAQTGVAAARTVMIGDSVHDMRMAAAAGVKALGVAWGFHRPDALRAAGAHMIVSRFTDIPAAVDSLIH